jgi:hypothetical protein
VLQCQHDAAVAVGPTAVPDSLDISILVMVHRVHLYCRVQWVILCILLPALYPVLLLVILLRPASLLQHKSSRMDCCTDWGHELCQLPDRTASPAAALYMRGAR